ncbi:MerR family transcriptional regulator [Streptomyces sp. HU2014]|uniref:Transcriptional regulator n=1 Tax=Streptomyces albireticuli TaxID=1940 RepID=A0A1Z2L049_9ACTN|nr:MULTISPECIES: MerR family transcriptional regulator [Streptomyces]ARZ67667.1 transcriptional regulator [Streptomyces albireticuli]UQI47694.1 MerR family transcriptional regulator [Streptomyces sp. HU2014]
MRLAELSERSGVSTATIKYYLREGLLQPGRRISATQSEYGEDHLRRLRLARALIQIGKVPVATAREVISAAEDEALDHHERLGAATLALPLGPDLAEDDPATETARRSVAELLRRLDWPFESGLEEPSPAHRTLIAAVAALVRLGYPADVEQLLPYGLLAERLAVSDLDLVERERTRTEQIEAAVVLTVLYEPVLLSLRRLAHAEESARRFL